jgi:DNA-binding transcriptional ArsR family regulator
MNVGICYDKDIRGEIIYSPLFELFASLHVLTKPEHHLDRLTWSGKTVTKLPEALITDIRELGKITDAWCIPMDFAHISPFSELTIPDAIEELERFSISQWNKIFKPYQKAVSKSEKSEILRVMREYDQAVFEREIAFLEPFLIRILKKELDICKEYGLLTRIKKYHERLVVEDTDIIFHKNRDYRYDINQLKKIVITASTFLSPHLMMYENEGILYLTMLVPVEEKKNVVPSDLAFLLKALGDETRLKILRELARKPDSTQKLAIKLSLTEAGISKHLKVMLQAGLVTKKRQGNYILYELHQDAIDFIPYRIYEYIMR